MKLNKLFSIYILACAVFLFSCEGGETFTTKSGTLVSYHKKGTEALKDSSVLLMNMKYVTDKGYDLFNSDERGGPITLPYYASQWDSTRSFYQVLESCKIGDSVSFELTVDELYVKTFNAPVPDTLEAESKVSFYIGVNDQMTFEEFQDYRVARLEKEQAKMAEEEKERTIEQGKEIDQYLADNNLTAITTESGLRYVVTKEGKGAQPKSGDVVIVNYTGKLMDGTQFDSSLDEGRTPFEFPLGQGRVIKGWDEGVALLTVGSEATLFVPSGLAYGPRGAGAKIKPNSILKFDVELLGIK